MAFWFPRIPVLVLLIFLAPAGGEGALAGPEISEFMAANTSGLVDEDGDPSDWIELTNPDSVPVDLAGWRLTDSPANSSIWVPCFPKMDRGPMTP